MSLTSHLQELRKKHEILSTEVEKAQRAPGSDSLRIRELKREKLRLKDEIQKASSLNA